MKILISRPIIYLLVISEVSTYLSLMSLVMALVRGLGEPSDFSRMAIFFLRLLRRKHQE